MSQTSLASAIRRRTKTEIVAKTTQGNIPIPPYKNNESKRNIEKNTETNSFSKKSSQQSDILNQPPASPLMMLLQHNQIISELQSEVIELKEAKNKNMNNPNEVEYYKKQYDSLLNEFSEIKKILVKTQTFSMETNLEMLNLKRLLEKNNIELPSNAKKETENIINEQTENLENND